MSARVFVHPKCIPAGAAQDALNATLETAGYDMAKTFIGPETTHKNRELVRKVEDRLDLSVVFERMDGTRFVQNPPPEAA